jgi:hypothetical protein
VILFDRVGKLLLMLVELAGSDQIDFLYLSLQRHIEQQIGMEFDQEDCSRLYQILSKRKAAEWKTLLRDYVPYLTLNNERRNIRH